MKQTKDYIEELLQRFFDGQTTEDEEQLLADYFRNAESIPEEWQVYKEIFNSFETDAYDFCQEELDAILVLADKKSKAVRLLPWASVACVVAIVGLLVWHPWVENPISEAPSVAQVKPKETTKDSADINVEEKLLVVEERVHEQTLAKQDNSSLLAEAKLSMRKRNEKKEALPRQKNENKLPRSTKETKQTVQPANSKEITTSELLETINLLVDVGNENITITSLPDNEGFAVKTISYGGESNSYFLKRCTENSSLELKSQVINFKYSQNDEKTILFLLFAVLSVANVCAQNSQNVLYVIDGKHVENFDGSQLKGKTIISYVISHPGRIYDIHDIRTTEYSKGAVNDSVKTIVTDSFSQPYVEAYAKASGASIKTVQAEAKETLYVVDGKIVPQSEMQKLSPSHIDSIKVIKDKTDPDYIKYSKEVGSEPTSIMIFKTK